MNDGSGQRRESVWRRQNVWALVVLAVIFDAAAMLCASPDKGSGILSMVALIISLYTCEEMLRNVSVREARVSIVVKLTIALSLPLGAVASFFMV